MSSKATSCHIKIAHFPELLSFSQISYVFFASDTCISDASNATEMLPKTSRAKNHGQVLPDLLVSSVPVRTIEIHNEPQR